MVAGVRELASTQHGLVWQVSEYTTCGKVFFVATCFLCPVIVMMTCRRKRVVPIDDEEEEIQEELQARERPQPPSSNPSWVVRRQGPDARV